MGTKRWLVLLALVTAFPAARAQTDKWPERPVSVVAPFAPGGLVDVLARMLAERLATEFGQPFVVDNRVGAGGTIGFEYAARAKPDGYTLIVVSSSFASTPALYQVSYDPIVGIAPISTITSGALILAVHPSVKAANLKEFVQLLRANPGGMQFGSAGTGTDLHLGLELFRQVTKTEVLHVPYKGAGPAMNDLLGGRIHFMLGTLQTFAPHLKAGKLRGLAVTTERRSAQVPELPAIAEEFPAYSMDLWFGMWAPAGTPREIVLKLNHALGRILKQPEVQERLRAGGLEASHSTPEEFSRIIVRDFAKWTRVIQTGKIRVN